MLYNIYCDESGHLEKDKDNPVMVLGALYCPAAHTRKIHDDIYFLKKNHGLSEKFEIKWTKISPSKVDFYLDLVDYFVRQDFLNFRALVIRDKRLDNERFCQTYDTWYYKMYYLLLDKIIDPINDSYNIYIDIKDTRSNNKTQTLHQYLSRHIQDANNQVIQKIQHVRSHEVSTLQMADLLIGAVMHENKSYVENKSYGISKRKIIERLNSYGFCSLKTIPKSIRKFNIFIWSKS